MSRLKRRARRERHFAMPLGCGLFLIFTLFIALMLGAVWWLMLESRQESLERQAEAQFGVTLAALDALVSGALDPSREAVGAARAMLESDQAEPADADAMRESLVPLMRGCPALLSLEVLRREGRSIEITRDGDTWLVRRDADSDGTVWERWDAGLRQKLSEQAGDAWPAWEPSAKSGRPGRERWIAAAEAKGRTKAGLQLEAQVGETPEARIIALISLAALGAGEDAEMPVAWALLDVSGGAVASSEGMPSEVLKSRLPEGQLRQVRAEQGEWLALARPHALNAEGALTLVAAAPVPALQADGMVLRNRLLAGGAAAWAAAAVLAWLFGRALGSPMRQFSRRAKRIDLLERSLGGRPRSLWREVDALYEALEEVSEEVAERVHSRELPVVVSAEPLRREGMKKGISTIEAMLVHATAAPATTADDVPRPEEPAVPEAYLQAIASTRRQLRRMREELEAQRASTRNLEHRSEEEGLQWSRSRDAAAELSALLARHGSDYDGFAAACAELVCTSADAARCSIWQPEGRGEIRALRLHAQHVRMGSHAESTPEICLARSAHQLLFSALEQGHCIAVRDAALDPRTAAYAAAAPWDPAPTGVLIAAGCDAHGAVVVLMLERASSAAWPSASEALACMAATALAAAWELTRRPEQQGGAGAGMAHEPEHHDEYTEPPLYRQLLEAQRGAVLALDRAGKVTFVNGAAEKLYGRLAPQWPGTAFSELAASGYSFRDAEALRRVLEGEDRVDIDTEHVTAHGSTALRLTWAPLEDEEGEITGAVVLAVDIRDIKDHTGELKRAEARFRGYVEGLPGVVFSVDTIGCINYVSPGAQQLYGYTPAELTGVSAGLLADGAQAERDREALAQLLQRGECSGYETLHRHRDGREIAVHIIANVRRDSEGQLAGAIGVVTPIRRTNSEE